MDKKKHAVLLALAAAGETGLARADFREATRREVSAHTVQEEQLDPLMQSGMITLGQQPSEDGRVKGPVDRYTITDAGRQALADVADAPAPAAA